MNSNKKKSGVNARKALEMATNYVVSSPNLSVNDIFSIANKYFENLQK